MESNLPTELLNSPVPPVALIGMDALGSHSNLWRAFSEGGGSRPLRWLLIDDPGNDLPKSPKARRTSYEWFIPKGILKTNWMSKYLNCVPSVAVIFTDLEWDCSEWNERKMEAAARVQAVRAALAGRGTKIALVLIQRKEIMLPQSEENSASERATALCSACELSARSLFVLPILAENLSGYITRLENAFYELAQNYYHQEIRGVKGHRDYLNKTTHLYLFVRHQFKCGFLNELKRDFHAAYKHYSQAYNLLMEVRATDTNIMEVKTIGGFINYKMCKLAFQLNLPRDAISQFRRHMDIFQLKVGLEELAFEHRGWQANQCSTFAAIFADAIKHGLPAIQTQHPGLYYQQAANYAVQRRKLAEELCSDAGSSYPDPDPLINEDSLEYYGQRPWRPGKVSIEPPDMELEQKGIKALLFREKNFNHSETIVDFLKKAIFHYKIFRSPRAESNLVVQMAEELVSSQKCSEALELLKPIVAQYRKDGWKVLLKAALQLALKCAFLVAAASDYIAFGLELAMLEEENEKGRIMTNLCRLLEEKPKLPSAEPGLTSKSERALVGEATKLWSSFLTKTQVVDVFLGPEVYELTALKVKVVFKSSFFKADQLVSIFLHLQNDFEMPLNCIQLQIKDQQDKIVQELKCENLKNNQTEKFTFEPKNEDVGKDLRVDRVKISIGNGIKVDLVQEVPKENTNLPLTEFAKREPLKNSEFIDLDTDSVDGQTLAIETFSCVKIEQREPQMKLEIEANGPSLVGEWFHIKVKLSNQELSQAQDLNLTAALEEADDLIIADTTRLTLDYTSQEPETPVTPEGKTFPLASPASKNLASLNCQDSTIVTFYIRSSTTGNRGIFIRASYKISHENGQTFDAFLEEKLNLETVEPFFISSEIFSCKNQQKMSTLYSQEPFLVVPQIKALSKHPIRILASQMEPRNPIKKMGKTPSQLKDNVLYQDSLSNECFALNVNLEAGSLEMQDLTLGKYVVNWVREEYFQNSKMSEMAKMATISNYELSSVKVCQSSLFAEAKIPAFAVARVPFGVVFKLKNRSSHVLEFNMNMESSEAFMLSGNKQLHFKISPFATYELHYVFYPLLAGDSVPLPRPKLSSARPAMPHDDVSATLERLLPSSILVLPRSRGKYSPSVEKKMNSNEEKKPFYSVIDPIVVTPKVKKGVKC